MSKPVISVVMPVYNAETYVSATVQSILTQSFRAFEFLIFDDGSADRSPAILTRWAQRDHRIQVFHEGHRGYVPWLNEGIARARGKYIARMDADDLSLPDRFALQIKYLETHPACVAVGSDCLLIDPQGAPIRRLRVPQSHEEIDARHLRGQGGAMAHPATMYRKEAVLRAGCYRPQYQYSEDLDLWLRMAEIGRVANLPEVLLKYRQHFQSVCHLKRSRQLELVRLIVTEACQRRGLHMPRMDQLPLPAQVESIDLQQYWAEVAESEGFRATARKHYWRVLQHKPWQLHLWRRLLDVTVPPLGTVVQHVWRQLQTHFRRPTLSVETTTPSRRLAA